MRKLVTVLLIIFIAAIIGILFILSFVTLDNNEVMLISIILTILSILSSWIVSHFYSESTYKNTVREVELEHQTKLKTYALKAAEKVNNLSSELNKLSFYLQEELEVEYENPQFQNLAREERIKSAIHLIGTLKSVNDTSLSDWKGVIGEELEEQEEDRKEQIDDIEGIINKYEEIISDLQTENADIIEENRNNEIKNELNNIQKDIRLLINNIYGTTAVRPRSFVASKRQDVSINCPNCKALLKYRQKGKTSSFKKVICENCQEVFIGRWDTEKGFYIEEEVIKNEKVNCPWCQIINIVDISNLPGSSIDHNCNKCNKSFKVTRTIKTLNVKPISEQPVLVPPPIQPCQSEEMISQVKNSLPPQPWPTGIHKIIAQQLKIPNRQVNLIIQELIRRGDFCPQIDGKVFQSDQVQNE